MNLRKVNVREESNNKKLLLENLPYYVLSDCCEYLNAGDLLNVVLIEKRLTQLFKRQLKMGYVDLRSHPMCSTKYNYVRTFFPKKLEGVLMLRGLSRYNYIYDNSRIFAQDIRSSNLTVLALEETCFDNNLIPFKKFPKSLLELSLRNTGFTSRIHTVHNVHFNGEIDATPDLAECLPNLHTLVLDGCMWLDKFFIQNVFQLPKLENLSMCECKPIDLPLIFNEGNCRKLRRLDVRKSLVNVCELLGVLPWMENLRELYLEMLPEGATPNRKAHLWADPRRAIRPKRNCVQHRESCSLGTCQPKANTKQYISRSWHQQYCCPKLHGMCLNMQPRPRPRREELSPAQPTVLFPPRYGPCVGMLPRSKSSPNSSSSSGSDDDHDSHSEKGETSSGVRLRYRPLKKKYQRMTRKRRLHVENNMFSAPPRHFAEEPRHMLVDHQYFVSLYSTNLHILCARNVTDVTPASVNELSQWFPSLRVLDLSGSDVCQQSLRRLCKIFEHVVHPQLCGCKPIRF